MRPTTGCTGMAKLQDQVRDIEAHYSRQRTILAAGWLGSTVLLILAGIATGISMLVPMILIIALGNLSAFFLWYQRRKDLRAMAAKLTANRVAAYTNHLTDEKPEL